MKLTKKVLLAAVLISTATFTGCNLTDPLSTASGINDDVFESSMVVLCDPVRTIAAERSLDSDGLILRAELCYRWSIGYE